MRPCYLVDIKTPKGYDLEGFLFGPLHAKRGTIFIHGLTASALGGAAGRISAQLVSAKTRVLTFNNRGRGHVNKIYKDAPRTRKGYTSVIAGSSKEVFTDCVDDIEGAINAMRKIGVKEIYLVGHSTGCQKAIYWASKKRAREIKGIVLLSPLSDYAAIHHTEDERAIVRATKYARDLVRRGKDHQLLPEAIWPNLLDAQRFLSLYTKDSAEEIFSYSQPKKAPKTLRKVRTPLLVLFAGEDEFVDRPLHEITEWFESNIRAPHRVGVVRSAPHSFKGGEASVEKAIARFMTEC